MRRSSVVALVAAMWLAPGLVLADDAADVAAARELATAGVILADAGKCDEAIEKLARAEKLHHAPTILGRLGECQVDVGKLVEGTENLQRVVREPLGANPPPAFVQAVARAQKVLLAAEPKIAKLTIHVEPETATVTIDGVTVSQAALGSARPMDPGPHAIDARAPGHNSSLQTVTLTTSQSATITIKLEKLPEPTEPEPPPKQVAPPPPPAPKKVEPRPPASHSPLRTIATVNVVVGGVALVAGATFGLFAIGGKNTLDRECPGKQCPEESRENLDTANRWATLSTVGLVVGGVAVVTGATLFVLAPTEGKPAPVAPTVGLGTIGLRGEF